MKKQIVVIHGGDYRRSQDAYVAELKAAEVEPDDFKRTPDWKGRLQERLGGEYEVFNPQMPLSQNASYVEWKIWIDKLVPFLRDGVILIGHSLGGIFWVKYLSENHFPKRVKALMLVAAPYDLEEKGKEEMSGFPFKKDLSLIEEQAEHIYLYHSTDDPIVEYDDVNRFKSSLPEAILRTFSDRSHLWQEEFPEIVRDIQALS